MKPHHRPVPSCPTPIIVANIDAAEYEVEALICHCTQKYNCTMKTEYLVKWKSYPLHEAIWKPCENLKNTQDNIYAY